MKTCRITDDRNEHGCENVGEKIEVVGEIGLLVRARFVLLRERDGGGVLHVRRNTLHELRLIRDCAGLHIEIGGLQPARELCFDIGPGDAAGDARFFKLRVLAREKRRREALRHAENIADVAEVERVGARCVRVLDVDKVDVFRERRAEALDERGVLLSKEGDVRFFSRIACRLTAVVKRGGGYEGHH